MTAPHPIVTVTPNPVVDISTTVGELYPDRKLRCGPARFEPGGGGVNCARVIRELGGRGHAIYPSGGALGDLLDELLAGADVERTKVATPACPRLGVHLRVEGSGEQYRLAFPGPDVPEATAQRLLDAVSVHLSSGGFVIGSGSLPPGTPHDFYAMLAEQVAATGGHLVLDTTGPWLRPALDVGVTVVRNNQREFGELLGVQATQPDGLEAGLRELVDSGAAQIAVMGLGKAGSLAVTRDRSWTIAAPAVDVISRVGAGDSLTGALTLALMQGRSVPLAVAYGVAAGAAAVTTPGTGLCRAEDTEDLYRRTLRENELE